MRTSPSLFALLALGLCILPACNNRIAVVDDDAADDDGSDDDASNPTPSGQTPSSTNTQTQTSTNTGTTPTGTATGMTPTATATNFTPTSATPTPSCTPEGGYDCFGPIYEQCVGGFWNVVETCTGATPGCDPTLGCIACLPGTQYCDNNNVVECNPDGQATSILQNCTAQNATCFGNTCLSECDLAAAQYSYLGCDFLAVPTSNALLDATFDNDFAIVIGNPASASGPANVTVTKGAAQVASQIVPAGQSVAIQLPYDPQLKGASQSIIVTDAAYEVHTDRPVVAYQYNPLDFTLNSISSYTNDASLLLAEHNLTGNYMTSTWPTWGKGEWTELFGMPVGNWDTFYPGFITIAATQDNTQITLTSSTATLGGSIPALVNGQQTVFTLNRGDVAQIFSDIPPNSDDMNYCSIAGGTQTQGAASSCPPTFFSPCENYCSLITADLTGSIVAASAPVAVFAGHTCTFMPENSWACDHLEETSFPLETWGQLFILTSPIHPDGPANGTVPTIFRIMSASAGNLVTFDPPGVHGAISLNAGEYVQFATGQDFSVLGSDKLYVTQALQGQDELGSSAGDPALGTGVSWDQLRADYDFLTPSTYVSNYVNVVAVTGSTVFLDSAAVTGWQPIGPGIYSVARVTLSPGSHHMESPNGEHFGITTYGYAPYTSYFYPGGLDFKR